MASKSETKQIISILGCGLRNEDKKALAEQTIMRIKQDIINNEYEAIKALIMQLPEAALKTYTSES
jgi:hypothetical protein